MAVSVKVDDDLKDRINRLASSQDRSEQQVIREAIEQYVTREEARRSFLDEAHESWAQYQRTKLHLTGEETCSWLDQWGGENEPGPPACHD